MKRVVSGIILPALALPALSACQKQSAPDPKAETSAIRAAENQMRAAYKARDIDKLLATYTPDATVYVPSEPPRVGAAALAEGDKKDFADPAFQISFTTAKAEASGDIGYTQGSFIINYTEPNTKQAATYSGYYLTVFRKQSDGSWKATEDMATPAS